MRRGTKFTGGAAVLLLQLQLGLLLVLWPPSEHRPAGTTMLAAAGGGSSGGDAEGGSKVPGGPPADNTTSGPAVADPKPVPCGHGSGVPCRGGGEDTQAGGNGSAGLPGGGLSRGGAASGRGGGDGAADDTGAGRSRGGGDSSTGTSGSGRGGRGGIRGGGASTGGGRGSPVPQTSPGCSAMQMQMYHQCISNCGGCAASMAPYAMIVAECTIPSGTAAIDSMHSTCDGHGSSSSSGNSNGRVPPPPPQYVHFSTVGHSGAHAVDMVATIGAAAGAVAVAFVMIRWKLARWQKKRKLTVELQMLSNWQDDALLSPDQHMGKAWGAGGPDGFDTGAAVAGFVCVGAGMAASGAGLVQIYNAAVYNTSAEECWTSSDGHTECPDVPSILEKVTSVLGSPKDYLFYNDVGDGLTRWPPAGAYIGLGTTVASLALTTFGLALLQPLRDSVCRRLQRTPHIPVKIPTATAGSRKCSCHQVVNRLFCCSPLAGRTQTISNIVQNVLVLALILRWVQPTKHCDDDGKHCARHWPWEHGSDGELDYLRGWGKHMGTVAGDAMAISLIPIPKNSVLLPAFGIPFERALRFHRQLGQFAVWSALMHGAVYAHKWLTTGVDNTWGAGFSNVRDEISPFCDKSTKQAANFCAESFKPGGDNEHTWVFTASKHQFANFAGVVAGSCFLVMLLSSINHVRRHYFEVFYKLHILCGCLSFWALLYHFKWGKLDVALPFLALMAADYLIRLFKCLRGGARVVSTEVFGDGKFIAIEFDGAKVDEPGQYFFVRVPGIARLQWHPFSVASAPGEQTATVVLKDLGDWTHELCTRPGRHVPVGARLRLDGPYGKLAVPLQLYEAVLLVCGGIGCTPMLAVLSSLAARAAAAAAAAAAGGPDKHRLKLVWFVWAVREPALVEHFLPRLAAASSHAGFKVFIHQTGGEHRAVLDHETMYAQSEQLQRVPGRPNMRAVLAELGHACAESQVRECAVLACGPDALLEGVKQNIATTSAPCSFEFHEETFDL